MDYEPNYVSRREKALGKGHGSSLASRLCLQYLYFNTSWKL